MELRKNSRREQHDDEKYDNDEHDPAVFGWNLDEEQNRRTRRYALVVRETKATLGIQPNTIEQ